MYEALKRIITAAEEVGPARDMTVVDWSGSNGKMTIIDGTTAEGLEYTMEVHLKRPGHEPVEGEK